MKRNAKDAKKAKSHAKDLQIQNLIKNKKDSTLNKINKNEIMKYIYF